MSDEVCRAIAGAASGFVEAPAGCGKTEAIARTISAFCNDMQLVLTHTHAGVDALRQRLKDHRVPSDRYHVDTIAGWAWGWVRKYPNNAGYRGSLEFADWNNVYAAFAELLQKDFVRKGVLNSYSGVIVDEYQDCTVPMHRLIIQLKQILPCRVLGDDLQGIFTFRDPLVSWTEVKTEYGNDLGTLNTPYRWINAQNEPLGRWLLESREAFRQGTEPNYRGSPIIRRNVSYRNLSAELISLTHNTQGRICVIGPKAHPLAAATQTVLVNKGYRILESNDLSILQKLIIAITDGPANERVSAACNFIFTAHGGLANDDKEFIRKIFANSGNKPRRADRLALFEKHRDGVTPELLLELIFYVENCSGACCKLKESVSVLKCLLEEHARTGGNLKSLYAAEIAKRKHLSRSRVFRCTGSTLLVKGLEFDHVVILRGANWQANWGSHRDLYVALTRGTKSTTLMELVQ